MTDRFFDCDFGFLKIEELTDQLASPTDFLDRTAARALIKACRNQGADRIQSASDYELFRAFCHVSPDLCGHPLLVRFEHLLSNCLGTSVTLTADSCDDIWIASVKALMLSSETIVDFVSRNTASPVRCLLASDAILHIPSKMDVVLDGRSLLQTTATDWTAWKSEMENCFASFAAYGCHSVYFVLPADFCDVEPNPYSVGQALQSREEKTRDLLIAQVFRFLSETCTQRGWDLILRVEAAAKDTLSLLQRTARTVGLPNAVWTAPMNETRDALIAFSLRDHSREVRCGICLADYPSDAELRFALSAYAARYPIGRLSVFTGVHLRDVAYEYQRFQSIISTHS